MKDKDKGEGFMHPPYKKPVGPTEKPHYVHGYKNFKSNLEKGYQDADLINFELGNKITGSGFPVYIDKGAKLQRALINYFLDKNKDENADISDKNIYFIIMKEYLYNFFFDTFFKFYKILLMSDNVFSRKVISDFDKTLEGRKPIEVIKDDIVNNSIKNL